MEQPSENVNNVQIMQEYLLHENRTKELFNDDGHNLYVHSIVGGTTKGKIWLIKAR
jgi:hypothetical protein